MAWSVFWETVRREWRGALIWGGVLAFFGLFTSIILPDSAGMQQMAEAFDAVPGFLWQLLGVDDIAVIATPVGFIGLRYFLTAAVIVAAWGVACGLNVTVNDEARGISNMVVSLPLPRSRMVVETILGYAPFAIFVPLAGFAGLATGIAANPNAATDLMPLLNASFSLTPVGLVVLCFTALVGAAIPRRPLVAAIGGGFVAASFLLKSVAGLAKSDFGTTMAQLSVFQHADALTVFRTGFAPVTTAIMLAIAAVMTLAAVRMYQARDLGA